MKGRKLAVDDLLTEVNARDVAELEKLTKAELVKKCAALEDVRRGLLNSQELAHERSRSLRRQLDAALKMIAAFNVVENHQVHPFDDIPF
jgi:hypothetical protein